MSTGCWLLEPERNAEYSPADALVPFCAEPEQAPEDPELVEENPE